MEIKKDIRNVLLVMPPATISREYTKEIQPPLGLAYIAACLESDYNVKIVDAACEGWHQEKEESKNLITYGLSFQNLKELIQDFKPDLIGVSCLYSMQYKNAHQVCAIAKELDKNILTVMGGAHPTALPQKTLQDINVDIVVLGEGESTSKELLAALSKGQDLSGIDGVAFRQNGKIAISPKTNFIQDLDQIPFPARHLLPMEKYFKINLRVIPRIPRLSLPGDARLTASFARYILSGAINTEPVQ